jgi:hypothetical protein
MPIFQTSHLLLPHGCCLRKTKISPISSRCIVIQAL